MTECSLARVREGRDHASSVSIINALVYQSEQLQKIPPHGSSSLHLEVPVTVSLFNSLNNMSQAGDTIPQRSKNTTEQVGARSTVLRMQCLRDHLTYYVSSEFLIVPRTVKVKDTIKLFVLVTNNPVGVSLLASILTGFYVLLVVKVTVLADNDPSQFYYLIQVCTGHRRKAAKIAKVIITLYGSELMSEPHHLCDPPKAVLEQEALGVFLLTTPSSRGALHGLWLWHDNSGISPSHLFSFMIVEKFTCDDLWLSVVTGHPRNQLTRVQRLACCTTPLLCNMLISVMFKRNGTAAKRDEPGVGEARHTPCPSDGSSEPFSVTKVVESKSSSCSMEERWQTYEKSYEIYSLVNLLEAQQ
ncbi:LOW QUALITY PROTEIN: polycystin-1-like protein 3 [Rhynchocyon petersi]